MQALRHRAARSPAPGADPSSVSKSVPENNANTAPIKERKLTTDLKDKLSAGKLKKPPLWGVAAVLAAVLALAVLILCLAGNNGVVLPKKNACTAAENGGVFLGGESFCPECFEVNYAKP